MITSLLIVCLLGYLIGSIPFGFLIGKMRGVDLRTEGSGNIGATNAVRVLGKKWGYLVFAGDFGKGAIAALSGGWIGATVGPPQFITGFGLAASVFCILGHNFPVWLGFKGGKGIATSAGIMLGFFPIGVFLAGIASWVIFFFTTRYVSVASIIAALSLPVSTAVYFYFGRADGWMLGTAILMAALAIWRHRGNIARLMSGTESRFQGKKKPEDSSREAAKARKGE